MLCVTNECHAYRLVATSAERVELAKFLNMWATKASSRSATVKEQPRRESQPAVEGLARALQPL